jgi:hypothetical protein
MNAANDGHPGRRQRRFLIRLWQVDAGGPWRASARDLQGGPERHFASPEALYAYLHVETSASEPHGP